MLFRHHWSSVKVAAGIIGFINLISTWFTTRELGRMELASSKHHYYYYESQIAKFNMFYIYLNPLTNDR